MAGIAVRNGGVILDKNGDLCLSCCTYPMLQYLTNTGGVIWEFDIRTILPGWTAGRGVFRLAVSPSGDYLFVETVSFVTWGPPTNLSANIFMMDITTNPPTVVDYLTLTSPTSPLGQWYISASDSQVFTGWTDGVDPGNGIFAAYGYNAGGFTGQDWAKAIPEVFPRDHVDCWDTSYRDGYLYVITRADAGGGSYYNTVSRVNPVNGNLLWGPSKGGGGTGSVITKPVTIVAVGGGDDYLVYGRTGGDDPRIERWTGEFGVGALAWTLDETDVPENVLTMANNAELDVMSGDTTLTSKLVIDATGVEVDDLGIDAAGCDIDGDGNSVLYDVDNDLFKTFDNSGAALESASHRMQAIAEPQGGYTVKFSDTREVHVYAAGTTYAVDELCEFNGVTYISLHGGNIGNQPDISPLDWAVETFDLQFIVGGIAHVG